MWYSFSSTGQTSQMGHSVNFFCKSAAPFPFTLSILIAVLSHETEIGTQRNKTTGALKETFKCGIHWKRSEPIPCAECYKIKLKKHERHAARNRWASKKPWKAREIKCILFPRLATKVQEPKSCAERGQVLSSSLNGNNIIQVRHSTAESLLWPRRLSNHSGNLRYKQTINTIWRLKKKKKWHRSV